MAYHTISICFFHCLCCFTCSSWAIIEFESSIDFIFRFEIYKFKSYCIKFRWLHFFNNWVCIRWIRKFKISCSIFYCFCNSVTVTECINKSIVGFKGKFWKEIDKFIKNCLYFDFIDFVFCFCDFRSFFWFFFFCFINDAFVVFVLQMLYFIFRIVFIDIINSWIRKNKFFIIINRIFIENLINCICYHFLSFICNNLHLIAWIK